MSITPDSGAPAATEQQAEGQAPPANETAEARIARLEAEAAETRKEAAAYRKRLREREAADEAARAQAEAAQAAAMAEQGKFRELYEAEKAKAAQAATLAETVTRYEAVLSKQAAALMDGVSDAIKGLLAKMPPADQVEWLVENRAALVATPAAPAPTPPARGTPVAPRGHAQPTPTAAEPRRSTVTL